jgi:Tfp pilus assembly protein PilP
MPRLTDLKEIKKMRTLQRISQTGLLLVSILVLTTFNIGLAAQEEVTNTDKALMQEEDLSKDNVKSETVADKGYIYDPTGKTDPFKSFISMREEKKEKDNARPKTELETLELSQLNLVVIVISPSGRWAMVKDSKDVGHIIKEGTLIGTNGGFVYKINEGEVIIREEYTDFKGQKQYNETIKTSTPSL